MLDITLFRDQPDLLRAALRRRGMEVGIVDTIRELDGMRRATLLELEEQRARRNSESKEIGRLADATEREARIAAGRGVNSRIGELEATLADVEAHLQAALLEVPNIPQDEVPSGGGAEDNVVLRQMGELPAADVEPLAHW